MFSKSFPCNFRFISQTFCMKKVLKASKKVLKTTEASLFCSQIVQFRTLCVQFRTKSYHKTPENSPIPTAILPRKYHEFTQVLKTTRIAYRNTQKDTRYDTFLTKSITPYPSDGILFPTQSPVLWQSSEDLVLCLLSFDPP